MDMASGVDLCDAFVCRARAGYGRDTGGARALQTMNIIIIVITRSHCSPLHCSSPAMSDQESGALASPTGGALQGRALLSMLQDGDPPQRASASEPQPLSRDEMALWSMQEREDAEIGADALNAATFGADAGQGWSFEENLAANRGLSPPGADGQGAEQSPGGPGREVQAWLQAAGQQLATAEDAAKRACAALAEVRASEADLTQRLAQMEAVAALGAEPGGREELRQAERTEDPSAASGLSPAGGYWMVVEQPGPSDELDDLTSSLGASEPDRPRQPREAPRPRAAMPRRQGSLTAAALAAAGPRAEQERLLWSHFYPIVYAALCEEALEDEAHLRDRLLQLPWTRLLEAMRT